MSRSSCCGCGRTGWRGGASDGDREPDAIRVRATTSRRARPRQDPKFKNIYWQKPRPGRVTAVFLSATAAKALKNRLSEKLATSQAVEDETSSQPEEKQDEDPS